MAQPRSSKRKKALKRVLALPDLEQAKGAVLASLTSGSAPTTTPFASSWPAMQWGALSCGITATFSNEHRQA